MLSFFWNFFQLKGKRFPFLGLVLAAIAGILTEDFFSCPSYWIFWISLSLGLLLLLLIWKKVFSLRVEQGFFFLFVALCFATLHAWQWQESTARQGASFLNHHHDDDIGVEGTVASEVKISPSHSASFFLNVGKIFLGSLEMKLPVTMLVHWEGPLPAYGGEVHLKALPRSPPPPRNPGEFNAAIWLARKEVATELRMDPSDPGTIISSGRLYKIMSWSEASRQYLQQLLALGIAGDPNVVKVIKAIVLGAKEQELVNFLSDFKLTGTMHLFAVSGLHVGMLAIIIWFFLKLLRLPRWSAVLITIPLLFFYVAITGFRIGSLRAVIMTSLVLCGFLFYRRPQIINSLAAAAFCLLAFETNLLFSIGWQFSFCVVFAILLLATPFQKTLHSFYEVDPLIPKRLITPFQQIRYDVMHHFAQLIAVSLAAWIGSLVPSIFYFHLISFSSLGANVVAVPLAFLILVLAALAVAFGCFAPWMATVFNNTNWLCAKLLLLVVHGFTLLPAGSLPISLSRPIYPTFTIFDFPSAQAAILQAEGRTWMINAGRAKNTAQTLLPFLEEQGTRHLQGVVLTEKEAAHLGGVMPLLKQISSSSFFASAGEGSSFLFKHFLKELTTSHQTLTMLHQGDYLNFSPSCWAEVLYPPIDSSETALVLKIHLTQTFHTSQPVACPKLMNAALSSNFDQSGMYSYSPDQNSSSALSHQLFPSPRCEKYEMFELKETTLLLMPSFSPLLEEWLMEHYSFEKLQATILVLPAMEQRLLLENRFMTAVAPHAVVVGSSSFKNDDHSNTIFKEVSRDLEQRGVRLLDQNQSGAVTIEALPQEVKLSGFLDQTHFKLPCFSLKLFYESGLI